MTTYRRDDPDEASQDQGCALGLLLIPLALVKALWPEGNNRPYRGVHSGWRARHRQSRKPGGCLATLLLVVVALLALTACGNSHRDLNGVPNRVPDKAEMYANVDGYPNVVRICIDHVAFATTTRENSPAAIMRVPEWDVSFCGAVPK